MIYFLFFNASSFTTENECLEKIDFIDNVKKAFDNEIIFQRWVTDRYHKYEVVIDAVKEIIVKLKDILTIIDKRAYRKLKKMVIESELLFSFKTGFPYLETRIIVNCICSILKFKKIYKKEGIEKCFDHLFEMYHHKVGSENNTNLHTNLQYGDLNELFDKIVFNEYEYIYSYIARDIINNLNSCLLEKDLNKDQFASTENGSSKVNVTYTETLPLIFDNSRKIIENILKLDDTNKTVVLASKDGLTSSKKYCYKMEKDYLSFEEKPLYDKIPIQELKLSYSKHRKLDKDYIKTTYMSDSFEYNLTSTKLLIPLIHFFTMISGNDAKYKILFNEKGLYETEWLYETEFDEMLVK